MTRRNLPTVREAVEDAAFHPDGLQSLIGKKVRVEMGEPSNGFLQYMRDQGAQRAYRNVLEWMNEVKILDVLGKINSELLVIDSRRTAFRLNSNRLPRKEEPCPKKEVRDRDLKKMLAKATAKAKGKKSKRGPHKASSVRRRTR